MKVLVAAVLSAGLLASGAVVVVGGGADGGPLATPQGPFGCCALAPTGSAEPAAAADLLAGDLQPGRWT